MSSLLCDFVLNRSESEIKRFITFDRNHQAAEFINRQYMGLMTHLFSVHNVKKQDKDFLLSLSQGSILICSKNETLCVKIWTTSDGMNHNTTDSIMFLSKIFRWLLENFNFLLLFTSSPLHSFVTFSSLLLCRSTLSTVLVSTYTDWCREHTVF